ncbi:MAG: transketolase family protein [Planctomycetes bacterium]|nr:transketolase family protein [Planctomycetota bacterium]
MPKATRQSFGEALAALGEKEERIVVLDADLSCSTKSELFAKKFPGRFFQMGIAEANMIGAAAGLALAGKVPFACSFACFLTGRFDIIRVSIAYARANVKLVGTHAGIGIGPDGVSQQGTEDLALMRALPGVTVVQPADDRETRQAVEALAAHDGPCYLRLTRQPVDDVHAEGYRFRLGALDVLRPGRDLSLLATGGTVGPALGAAKMLAARGIEAEVINVHTIKPLDVDALARSVSKTGRVVTVEDHTVIGGMGGAVAEALGERHPAPLKRLGLLNVFGESGASDALYEKYGLDAPGIARSVGAWLRP